MIKKLKNKMVVRIRRYNKVPGNWEYSKRTYMARVVVIENILKKIKVPFGRKRKLIKIQSCTIKEDNGEFVWYADDFVKVNK